MFKFFQKYKRLIFSFLAVVSISLGFVLFSHLSVAQAYEIDILAYIKSGFWSLLIWVGNFIRLIFGMLLLVLLKLVVTIGKYNNFINNNYVKTGWVILRDVCNMFFILGLLFIAFVTVLKIEKYQWNKFLARLLIMAILINFSKTICGVIIDFFQVLMLTFVNSFQDIAEGTIFYGLGMADIASRGPTTGGDMTSDSGMMGAAATLLGAAFIVIACVTVLIFAIILAFRVVALWMLIVISPLAFFSYAFEEMGGKIGSISSRWWGQFLNYCMIGPFMAFFLWLSLTTMTAARATGYVDKAESDKLTAFKSCEGNSLCQADQMLGFLMGIIMLLGGLMMSGEFAVVGSSYATRFAGAVQGGAQRLAEGTVRRGAAVTAGVVGGAALYAPKRVAALGLAAGKGLGLAARDTVNRSKRLRYFTKEGQKEMGELVTSRLRRIGPSKLAVEQTRKEHQKKDEERLTTEGAFNDSDTWRSRMNEAKTKGDFREYRALISRGAKEGWMNTRDVTDFKGMNKKYGGVIGMNEREELAFTEELGKDYETKTKRHIRTNDKYISPEGKILEKDKDAAGEYKDVVGRMKANDQSDMAENKKFGKSEVDPETGEETNEFWKEELLAFSGETENFGRYNPQGRRNIASSIEDIFNDEKKLAQFDSTQQKQMADMYEAATAKYKSNGERVDGDEGKGLIITDKNKQAVQENGLAYIPVGMRKDSALAGQTQAQQASWANTQGKIRQRNKEEGFVEPPTPKTKTGITGVTPLTSMKDDEIQRRRHRLGLVRSVYKNIRQPGLERTVDEDTGKVSNVLTSPIVWKSRLEKPKPVESKEAFGLTNDELKKILDDPMLDESKTNKDTARSYKDIEFTTPALKSQISGKIATAIKNQLISQGKLAPGAALPKAYQNHVTNITDEIIKNRLDEVKNLEWERDKQADTLAELQFMEKKGRRAWHKPMSSPNSSGKKGFIGAVKKTFKIKGGTVSYDNVKRQAGPQTGDNLRAIRKEIEKMRAEVVIYQKEMKRKGITVDLDELKKMHLDISAMLKTAQKNAISEDEFQTIQKELDKVNADLFTNRLVKTRT